MNILNIFERARLYLERLYIFLPSPTGRKVSAGKAQSFLAKTLGKWRNIRVPQNLAMVRAQVADLQVFFPEYCEACEKNLSNVNVFCSECFSNIEWFDSAKSCAVCGETLISGNICPVCSTREIFYNKAKFIYNYSQTTIPLIEAAKFKQRRRCVQLIRKHISNNLTILPSVPFCIVPVPSSHKLVSQVVKCLSKHTGMKVENLIIKRKSPKIKTLSRHQRFAEIQHSYDLKTLSPVLPHENILLVDDVLTTGATTNFTARLLHEKLGIPRENIWVFALARRTRTTQDEDS